MNSLCSVSNVAITTRTASQSAGATLTYDHMGTLLTNTPAAHRLGTTVQFSDLFSNLPVRREEFHRFSSYVLFFYASYTDRHSRKEFNRMQEVLQSYALIRSDVRFTITHTPKGGYSLLDYSRSRLIMLEKRARCSRQQGIVRLGRILRVSLEESFSKPLRRLRRNTMRQPLTNTTRRILTYARARMIISVRRFMLIVGFLALLVQLSHNRDQQVQRSIFT